MVTIVQPLLSEEETDAVRSILEYLSSEAIEYANLRPEERPKHIYHSVLVLRACGYFHSNLFELGRTVFTPGASEAMEYAKQQPWEFLTRHSAGDWGNVGFDDWQENEISLEKGLRLLSSYRTTTGEALLVITEADRSVTTVLLPEEY